MNDDSKDAPNTTTNSTDTPTSPPPSDFELLLPVTWNELPFQIPMPLNSTIGQLKAKLQEITGIAVESQKLANLNFDDQLVLVRSLSHFIIGENVSFLSSFIFIYLYLYPQNGHFLTLGIH